MNWLNKPLKVFLTKEYIQVWRESAVLRLPGDGANKMWKITWIFILGIRRRHDNVNTKKKYDFHDSDEDGKWGH